MQKQSVVRFLLHQLAARVSLDKSLGAGWQNVVLPARRDLSQKIISTSEEQLVVIAESSFRKKTHGIALSVSGQGQLNAGSAACPSLLELDRVAGADLAPLDLDVVIADKEAELQSVCQEALGCTRCSLHNKRTRVVFGEGNLNSDLIFVGDAPGRDEDLQGIPFVGRAGEMLTAMIEKGMRRARNSVYICNILKCRPPGNRDPEPEEVRCCNFYLQEQLRIIQPKMIIALGRIAGQILSAERISMKRLRGKIFNYRGIALLPIYHPAYLLRLRERAGGKTEEDRLTWQDLQKAMQYLRN